MEYLLSNANNAKVINSGFSGIINLGNNNTLNNTPYPNGESVRLINIDNRSFDNKVQSIIRYIPRIKSLNIIRSEGGNIHDKKTIHALNKINDVSLQFNYGLDDESSSDPDDINDDEFNSNEWVLSTVQSLKIYIETCGALRLSVNETNNANKLLKSTINLRSLMIDDKWDALLNFNDLSLPKSIKTLKINCGAYSTDIIKKWIKSLPNLNKLTIKSNVDSSDYYDNFESWKNDEELHQLLDQLPDVVLIDTYDHRGGFNHNVSTLKRKRYVLDDEEHLLPKKRQAETESMDADTAFYDTTFELERIFQSDRVDNPPHPAKYRLNVFHDVDISNDVSQHPFTLKRRPNPEIGAISLPMVNPINHSLTEGQYIGKQLFSLDSSWQPIASLTPSDVIMSYRLLSKTSSKPNVDIGYSSSDALYYIRSEDPVNVVLEFVVQTKSPEPIVLDEKIQEMVRYFNGFGQRELHLSDKESRGIDCIKAIVNQKTGACRHRSVAFFWWVHDSYPNEFEVRIIANDCHMFVEVKQGNHWITCDLGGYFAQTNIHDVSSDELSIDNDSEPHTFNDTPNKIRYISDQQRIFENYLTKKNPKEKPIQTLDDYIEQRLTCGHKRQLISLSQQTLLTLNQAMLDYATRLGHPVFDVQTPEDLVCSAAFIERVGNKGYLRRSNTGSGPLHDFLTQTLPEFSKPLVLMVNYSRFKANDALRFNQLIDDHERFADGTKLPENTLVIGLIQTLPSGEALGADFSSRFDYVGSCPLTLDPFKSIFEPRPEPSHDDICINVCRASHWHTQLMGGWTLNKGELLFESGELRDALHQNKNILIQNPPTTIDFELFFHRAKTNHYIMDGKERIPVHSNQRFLISNGYDWSNIWNQVSCSERLTPNAHVLNPTLLCHFIRQYQVDSNQLVQKPGIIHDHMNQHASTPLELFLTRCLSEDEWGLFFKEVARYPTLHITLTCAPDATIPSTWPPHSFMTEHRVNIQSDSHTQYVYADDRDLAIAQLTSTTDATWMVLDISECSASDLLTQLGASVVNETFHFTHNERALLKALNNGQHILLTGTFSTELLDGLMPFLWARSNDGNKKGQLIIVSEAHLSCFEMSKQVSTWEQKLTELKKKFNESSILALKEEYADEPLVHLITRLRYEQSASANVWLDTSVPAGTMSQAEQSISSECTWDGLTRALPAINEIKEPNLFDSKRIKGSAQFTQQRYDAVCKTLNTGPYVFLAGLTGVGKSRFVEDELGLKHHLFHGESSDNICHWANAKTTENKWLILFLDEANLSMKQWSEFEGLFQTTPGILINGQYYLLTPAHKVIFAGNPLNYGGDRRLAPFFKRHGSSVVFQPLPAEFVYQKTIEPILRAQLAHGAINDDEIVYLCIGTILLKIYHSLIQLSRDEVLISPRQMEQLALCVAHDCNRHDVSIWDDLAYYHAYQMAMNSLSEQDRKAFICTHKKPVYRSTILLHEGIQRAQEHYSITSSRMPLLNDLDIFLQLRSNQQQTNWNGFQHTGLNRFVIEAEPGLGKSELVKHVFMHSNTKLVRILPSMLFSEQEALLLEAFDQGNVVVIDEINSMPSLEKLLNSLLDGKHPFEQNRPPNHPGFRLIGTQNSATTAGRRVTSPALSNRTILRYLPHYSKEELYQIVEKKGLHPSYQQDLIEGYFAAREVSPEGEKPSCRDLMRLVDRIIQVTKGEQTVIDASLILSHDLDDDTRNGNTTIETMDVQNNPSSVTSLLTFGLYGNHSFKRFDETTIQKHAP